MARKSKGVTKRTKIEITPADYRFPGESGLYWVGFIGIAIAFAWIVVMFLIFKKQASGLPDWQWLYLLAWPVASIWLANFLSARKRQAQIKKSGRAARVMTNNNPGLFAHSASRPASSASRKSRRSSCLRTTRCSSTACPEIPAAW